MGSGTCQYRLLDSGLWQGINGHWEECAAQIQDARLHVPVDSDGPQSQRFRQLRDAHRVQQILHTSQHTFIVMGVASPGRRHICCHNADTDREGSFCCSEGDDNEHSTYKTHGQEAT